MQQTKHTSTSNWSEFEPKLERLVKLTGSFLNEIMMTVGYARASNIAKWRAEGKVPTRASYAISGYLQELSPRVVPQEPQEPLFSFDELVALFGVLNGWQIPTDIQKALAKKIAKQVTNGPR